MPGQKGNGGEREVSKLLQDWWQTEFPAVTFARTPQSGGWVKNQTTAGFNLYGDVISTDPNFPFSVEVKRDESWNLAQLQKRCPTSPLWDWWLQCQADAIKSKKLPILFFRKNRQPWYVWIPGILKGAGKPCVMIFTNEQLCSIAYGRFWPVMLKAETFLENKPSGYLSETSVLLNPG